MQGKWAACGSDVNKKGLSAAWAAAIEPLRMKTFGLAAQIERGDFLETLMCPPTELPWSALHIDCLSGGGGESAMAIAKQVSGMGLQVLNDMYAEWNCSMKRVCDAVESWIPAGWHMENPQSPETSTILPPVTAGMFYAKLFGYMPETHSFRSGAQGKQLSVW